MADKSINNNTAVETPTMTPDKSSSGFIKFCAFIDVIAKLLIAGALIGILVVMVQFSSSIDKLLEGNASLSVKVWSGDGALRITPAYSQAFQVNMQNSFSSPGSPIYFKAVN